MLGGGGGGGGGGHLSQAWLDTRRGLEQADEVLLNSVCDCLGMVSPCAAVGQDHQRIAGGLLHVTIWFHEPGSSGYVPYWWPGNGECPGTIICETRFHQLDLRSQCEQHCDG